MNKNNARIAILIILFFLLPLLLLSVRLRQFLLPRAEAPTAEVIVQPENINKAVGESFSLDVSLLTTEPVSAAYLLFSFNQNVVTLEDVAGDLSMFTDNLSLAIDENQPGKVSLSLVAKREEVQMPKGTIPVARITFRGVGSGTTGLSIEQNPQVVGPDSQPGFTLFDVIQQKTPTIIIGEQIAGEEVPISFSMRFNGIVSQGLDIPIVMRAVNSATGETRDTTVTVSANNQGIYQASGKIVLPDFSTNARYNLLVKGPKHLRRRMESRVGLNPTANTFDWTAKPLEPGDLPNPNQGGVQDGVVNALDASLLLERIDKTDSDSLKVADLNYDGVVNLNDFSLLIATLSSKTEDDD